MKIGGLVLAAGASRRMGTPKAMLPIGGETFLSRMVRVLRAGCDRIVVVAPPETHWICPEAEIVVNPDPERGMLSSLQCGLSRLGDCEHVLFTPMDLPSLAVETIAQIAAAAARASVVIPRQGEERGHPVAIDRVVAAELMAASGVQPRDIIRRDDSRVLFLDVDDPGVHRDIDRPEDYQNLLLSIPC